MPSSKTEYKIIDRVLSREGIMNKVTTTTYRRSELVEELTISRSTVYRALNELEKLNLIESSTDGYQATPLGKSCYVHADRLMSSVSQKVCIAEITGESAQSKLLIDSFPDSVNITVGDEVRPNILLDKLKDKLGRSDSVMGYLKAAHSPFLDDEFVQSSSGELVVSESVWEYLISSEGTVNTVKKDRPNCCDLVSTDGGRYTIKRAKQNLPFDLLKMGEKNFTIIISNSDGIQALIDHNSEKMAEWAEPLLLETGFES